MMFDILSKGLRKWRRCLFAGCIVFVLSSILFATDGYAVFESMTSTGTEIFTGMRKIIFAAAGFGILAVATGAIFGALNWKWLAAIVIGVVVIATTAQILKFMTAGTGANVSVSGITDTLKTGDSGVDNVRW